MKRGQATIFIILGIAIMFVVVGAYTFKDEISQTASQLGIIKASTLPPEIQEKKTTVETCLSDLLAFSTYAIAAQGGYEGEAQHGSLDYDGTPIAYYYDKGADKTPTEETIAEEISSALKEAAPLCAEEAGLEAPPKAAVRTTIEEGKITSEVRMTVQASMGESTETISTFTAESTLGLGRMLNAARQIVTDQKAEPGSICLTCVNDLMLQSGLEAEMQQYEDSTIITISDPASEVEGDPLKLSMAMRN